MTVNVLHKRVNMFLTSDYRVQKNPKTKQKRIIAWQTLCRMVGLYYWSWFVCVLELDWTCYLAEHAVCLCVWHTSCSDTHTIVVEYQRQRSCFYHLNVLTLNWKFYISSKSWLSFKHFHSYIAERCIQVQPPNHTTPLTHAGLSHSHVIMLSN